MREKNGFIATSVLYAFLIAFLTLFLGFMANYIQNKQLINRIEDMAREELDSYGNVRISSLEIGDYVVLDTIDDEGDGNSNVSLYSSPINPDTRWILYKIDETTDEVTKKNGDDEETVSKQVIDYYFVSDVTAQKFTPIATANIPGDFVVGDGKTMTPTIKMPNLRTLSELMNYNIYYDVSSKSYISFPASVDAIRTGAYVKVFSYEFLYNKNDGIGVKFLSTGDLIDINSIPNDKIKDAIYNQKSNYSIWNDPDNSEISFDLPGIVDEEGFIDVDYASYGKNETNDSAKCDTYLLYGHKFEMSGSDYDSCYYARSFIGSCLNSTDSKCNNNNYSYNPRYVAVIRVNADDESSDGYIDSGNGTRALPYLITKGGKK